MNDIIEIIRDSFSDDDIIDLEEHLHRKGIMGASALLDCPMKRALDYMNFPDTPKPQGEKANHGPFWFGKMIHKEIQNRLDVYFKNQGIFSIAEVYVVVPITKMDLSGLRQYVEMVHRDFDYDSFFSQEIERVNYFTGEIVKEKRDIYDLMIEHPEIFDKIKIPLVISPIDYAILDGPENVYLYPFEFKNITKKVPLAFPGARFNKIYDIKTMGAFAYNKLVNQHKISPNYAAQFYVYLKGTGLKTLSVIAVEKAHFYMNEIEVSLGNLAPIKIPENIQAQILEKYDLFKGILKRFSVIEHNNSYLSLVNQYRPRTPLEFDCLRENSDNFTAYCPYNESHEEKGPYNIKVIQDNLCDLGWPSLAQKVRYNFEIGAKYRRKSTIVKIQEIIPGKDGYILSISNNDRKVFRDPLFFAFKEYRAIKTKEPEYHEIGLDYDSIPTKKEALF